jgi:methionine-rich copper-binding protein CopC
MASIAAASTGKRVPPGCVNWHVVSIDTHRVEDAYMFTVR